ncbi:MAG: hypothetical protein J1D87_01060 [Lachnospiraceae bacterium]|nr:hypothetical protein [Lachnospiraceae bacterium]
MIIGFVIWSIVSVIFLVIGISSWRSENEVGFFTGVNPPKMRDVTAYNHAVGKIWFWFAGLFEITGITFLFIEQNSPVALLMVVAVVLLVIGLIIAYLRVEAKYRIDSHSGGAQP